MVGFARGHRKRAYPLRAPVGRDTPVRRGNRGRRGSGAWGAGPDRLVGAGCGGSASAACGGRDTQGRWPLPAREDGTRDAGRRRCSSELRCRSSGATPAARPLVDAERQGSAVARGPVIRGGCKAHGATGVVPTVSVVHRCLPDRDGSNAIENKRSTFYQPKYKQLGSRASGCDRVGAPRRAARLITYFGGGEPHFRDWSIWAVNGKSGAATLSRNDR